MFVLIRAMFENARSQRLAQAPGLARSLKDELISIERQIDNLLDRIAEATSATIVRAYEAKINKPERRKRIAAENNELSGQPQRSC